jgi:hypothetical protein
MVGFDCPLNVGFDLSTEALRQDNVGSELQLRKPD